MLFLVLLSLAPFFASVVALFYLLTIEGHLAWRRARRLASAGRMVVTVGSSVEPQPGRAGQSGAA